MEFEPTISAGERPQTYALDRAGPGTGKLCIIHVKYGVLFVLRFVTLAFAMQQKKKKKFRLPNKIVLSVSLRSSPTSEINAGPYNQNFIQQSPGIARFTEQRWEIRYDVYQNGKQTWDMKWLALIFKRWISPPCISHLLLHDL